VTHSMDVPELRPNLNVAITFPEDSTEDQMLAGAGQDIVMSAEGMTQHIVILALLRAAESVLMGNVREGLEAKQGPLHAPPSPDVAEALVALNTRLAALGMLGDMPMSHPKMMGLSI